MNNRTVAIIVTLLAVFCCGCPGLTMIFLGMISFVDFAGGFGFTGITDQNGYLAAIFGGICGGLILIALVILIAFLLFRKKKETPPTTPDEPLPPTI